MPCPQLLMDIVRVQKLKEKDKHVLAEDGDGDDLDDFDNEMTKIV